MLRTLAYIFGIVFLIAGILGFVPVMAPKNMLLGLFCINPIYNVVHIVAGIVAFSVSQSTDASRLFFRVFGFFYFLLAILGFFPGIASVLGIVANNMPDVGLHTVIAIVSLYLGFSFVDLD